MHESKINEPYIKIEKSNENFDFWINKDYINEEIRQKLKECNVLVLPDEGFRDRNDIHFPVGTIQLFHFLEKKKSSDFMPEVCFGDDNYKELALHSDLTILGTFLATNIGLPLLVNHLYDFYKTKYGKVTNKNVKIKLIEQEENKVRKLTYEGPAEDFNKYIIKSLKDTKR